MSNWEHVDKEEIIISEEGLDEAIHNAYLKGRNDVLDKIKEEIQKEENIWYHDCEPDFSKDFDVIRVDTVLSIINKYRESER